MRPLWPGGEGGGGKPRLALGDVYGALTPAKKRESEAVSPVSAGAALTPIKVTGRSSYPRGNSVFV